MPILERPVDKRWKVYWKYVMGKEGYDKLKIKEK
jgi:hypothetical protein